ncbi:MAG: polyprenyl synthetase family protein [Bacteroidales bacterium]|jgi:geranylgeranyl diphosphate synthase type II|nr:polyprenyl synthetase family protein [Bacteroidales bacterium]MDI9576430.1 polyprenyl synthetase family protein [Bacteroidota bacterium]MDY0400375.1 polyprenyl synthetase family protein [Bacteroidales bacterium]HHW59554.1 polyprenyl synthetase family protein [Bacteroidales bacterium]
MKTLNIYINYFKKHLNELDLNREPKTLYDPIKYGLGVGGKRFRPALILLLCDFYGGNLDDAIPAALGIELFHNFTLFHDDIMDKAQLRRGKETVVAKYGLNTALLAGDTLFAIAYSMVNKTNEKHLNRILEEFTNTATKVCEGQQLDMDYETQINVTKNDYEKMIYLKTAVLIASSMKIGAIIGNCPANDENLIYDIGISLGLAFQLQDDYFDCFGNENTFGKKIGGDIVDAKKTFLYVSACESINNETERKYFYDLYNNKNIDNEEKIKKIITIYKNLNIDKKTIKQIDYHIMEAKDVIHQLSIDNNKKDLISQVIDDISNRNK